MYLSSKILLSKLNFTHFVELLWKDNLASTDYKSALFIMFGTDYKSATASSIS